MAEERVNSFADIDLASEFAPTAKPKPVIPKEETDQLAEKAGFPSRQAPKTTESQEKVKPRGKRYRTGRNQQLNIKVTSESIELFYKLADEINQPLGEVFDQAIKALQAARKKQKK